MAAKISLRGRHFVCPVKEDVITDWKRLLARFSRRTGAPHFVFGSDSSKFSAYARPRSTLWVVLLRDSEHPVLVARLKVVHQHHRDQPLNIRDPELATLIEHFHRVKRNAKRGWEHVAVGSRSRSRFFPRIVRIAAISSQTSPIRGRGPRGWGEAGRWRLRKWPNPREDAHCRGRRAVDERSGPQ